MHHNFIEIADEALLAYVTGGDENIDSFEYGGGTGGDCGFGFDEPVALVGPPSIDDAIGEMSPAGRDTWPTEADVDTTGVVVQELTPQQQFDQQVDLIQNFRDAASSPELIQGEIGDCYAVAAINAVAQTPEGQAHLQSMVTPLGDGVYNVTLQGPDGPVTVGVALNNGEVFASGPEHLQAIEKAIVYTNSADPLTGVNPDAAGGNAGLALAQIGLSYVYAGDAPSQDAAAVAQVYGQDGHAYAIGGTLVDPSTGATVLVPMNPWGVEQIGPIPADSDYVYTGTLDP